MPMSTAMSMLRRRLFFGLPRAISRVLRPSSAKSRHRLGCCSARCRPTMPFPPLPPPTESAIGRSTPLRKASPASPDGAMSHPWSWWPDGKSSRPKVSRSWLWPLRDRLPTGCRSRQASMPSGRPAASPFCPGASASGGVAAAGRSSAAWLQPSPARLFLGDNGGRLAMASPPRQFAIAERHGIMILPGSDPLPLAAEREAVGALRLRSRCAGRSPAAAAGENGSRRSWRRSASSREASAGARH